MGNILGSLKKKFWLKLLSRAESPWIIISGMNFLGLKSVS